MGLQMLTIGISFFTCLIGAALLFSTLCKISFLRENLLASALAFTIPVVCVNLLLIFFFWYPYDFVVDISAWQYLAPLLCCLFIAVSLFFRFPFATEAGVLLASFAAVFLSQTTPILFQQIPLWLNYLLASLILFGFSLGWRCLCGLNPLSQIESITISSGILLLSLFGIVPFILGASAASILGASAAAYFFSSSHPLGIKSSPLIGFIFGWLGLMCYGEYLLPCFAVFAMFYLLELVVSTSKKLAYIPNSQNIAYNTVSLCAFAQGLPATNLLRVVWSTNILLLILGLLQIHGYTTYSLPFFATLLTSWQLYRLFNWQRVDNESKPFQSIITSLRNLFSSNPNKQDKS